MLFWFPPPKAWRSYFAFEAGNYDFSRARKCWAVEDGIPFSSACSCAPFVITGSSFPLSCLHLVLAITLSVLWPLALRRLSWWCCGELLSHCKCIVAFHFNKMTATSSLHCNRCECQPRLGFHLSPAMDNYKLLWFGCPLGLIKCLSCLYLAFICLDHEWWA